MRSIMQNNVLFLTSQGHASQVLFDHGNKRLFERDFEPKTTGMRFPVYFFVLLKNKSRPFRELQFAGPMFYYVLKAAVWQRKEAGLKWDNI